MKKQIILISPPFTKSKTISGELKYPPMGLTFLASTLRNYGYVPVIFDGVITKNPWEKLEKLIRSDCFDVAGISFTSMTAEGAFETACRIKKINPEITIIAGGYHPTALPRETLQNKNFDFVVYGEAEETLPELLNALDNKTAGLEEIKGIAFQKQGETILTPPRPLIENLDDLPLPAYDLLDLNAYSSPATVQKPFISYIRSRGCPFLCTFCGVQKMFTRKYRVESPQKTINNIDYLVKNFNIKEILFKDSEFLINPQNVMEFCDLLSEKNYNLVWGCNARVDMVTEELLQKMEKAGCRLITYGIESGDQTILDRMNKGITLEQSREAVALTKKTTIKCVTNFMFGNPEETEESMNKTIQFAKELDADYAAFNYLMAFPGSKIYEEALEKNWFVNGHPQSYSYQDSKFNATQVSLKKLDKFFRKAIFSFYFRPTYIARRFKNMNLSKIKNNFIGLWSIIKKI